MPATLHTQDRVIVEHLRTALPGIVAIYRFGSTAHGVATQSSDIDIAVLAQSPIPADIRFDLQEQLAAKLGRDVDLVDVATTSPVMAIQVVAHGTLLYEGDSAARGQFEDLTFSIYARLNEERRGILERVATEGTTMADDVLLNKAAAIERAVQRVREEYAGDDRNLVDNQTRQDIDAHLADRLKKMVGFRNVAVHDYQKLNLDIVRRIVVEHLDDFLTFTRTILRS